MSYFKDLTPYEYFGYYEDIKNVGWLDGNYAKAIPSKEFVEKLRKYEDYTVAHTMGFHECPYCPPAEEGRIKSANGTCEIRVVGAQGEVYACPVLIIHYVEEHHYCPPQEFWKAVMEGPEPGSDEYNRAIERANASFNETFAKLKRIEKDKVHAHKFENILVDELAKSVDKEIIKDIFKLDKMNTKLEVSEKWQIKKMLEKIQKEVEKDESDLEIIEETADELMIYADSLNLKRTTEEGEV